MNLYSTHAREFSNTRVKPWEGWTKCLDYFPKKKKIKILDLGCGNGRFLEFILSLKQYEKIEYLGVDNSEELLTIAKEKFKTEENVIFVDLDLSDNNWEAKLESYDLIGCFGVMHHIEKYEERVEILKKSYGLLNENGIMVFTFWQFGNNEKFLEAHKTDRLNAILDDHNFSEHDYTLSFGKNGAERFAHHFAEQEIESMLMESNISAKTKFYADGKDSKMNCYVITEKSDSI